MIVIVFGLLGAVTGAITAAILLAVDFKGYSLYIVPGAVFGIAFGVALWHRRWLRPERAVAYLVAAGLANAAAVFIAIYLWDDIARLVGKETGPIITGVIAGAVGAGLLTGMTAVLVSIARWPLPIATGALLGALLPIFVDGPDAGIFAFYIVWQGGFAAAVAATLPPREAGA
jgi:hypothetical protein